MSLSPSQMKEISDFKESINKTKLSNENKIYLGYFIDSLLSDNYWWAANTGFVFLEKFLRTELIFLYYWKNKESWEFLHLLDYYENLIENGEEWKEDILSLWKTINSKIKKYWCDPSIRKEELISMISNYCDLINEKWPLTSSQLSFNWICDELGKNWILEKKKAKNLKSLYSKYRNPLHHWLFKKLMTQELVNSEIPIARYDETKWVDIINVSTSNMILRENWIINQLLENISLWLYYEIRELIFIFNK